MIEILYERVRRGALAWAAPARRLHPGWCAVALVLVVVAGRYLAVSRAPHREEIAAAFGSASLFYSTPQMDAVGGRVGYVQQSDAGRTVRVLDLRTGRTEQIREETGPTHSVGVDVWPWAPDDRELAYSMGTNLFVWPASGSMLDEGLPLGGRVTDLVWVETNRLVCVVNRKRVCHIREEKGRLELLGDYPPPNNTWNITSLNAVGTRAVAWVNANQVWRLELGGPAVSPPAEAGSPTRRVANPATVWLDPKRRDLGDLAVCPQTGQVLYTCGGEQGDRQLWRWEPARGAESVALVFEAAAITQTRWVGRDQYAFVSRRSGESCLTLAGSGPEATTLPLSSVGQFNAAPDGKRLLVTGIGGNELSEALWEYDILTGDLKCLASGIERPWPAATLALTGKGFFALPSGARWEFFIVRPSGYDSRSRRKYPVIVGNTTFAFGDPLYQGRRPLWTQALANCGFFVVVVNRPSWMGEIEKWAEPVMALYPRLAENPRMDLDQAYLFGASAETSYMSKLVNDRPELWKGVILMNPGGLPDLSAFPAGKPVPRMLISYGELERQQERIKRYQEEAAKRGIDVETILHRNAGHWLQARGAVLERTRAIIRFVSDEPLPPAS